MPAWHVYIDVCFLNGTCSVNISPVNEGEGICLGHGLCCGVTRGCRLFLPSF